MLEPRIKFKISYTDNASIMKHIEVAAFSMEEAIQKVRETYGYDGTTIWVVVAGDTIYVSKDNPEVVYLNGSSYGFFNSK